MVSCPFYSKFEMKKIIFCKMHALLRGWAIDDVEEWIQLPLSAIRNNRQPD